MAKGVRQLLEDAGRRPWRDRVFVNGVLVEPTTPVHELYPPEPVKPPKPRPKK